VVVRNGFSSWLRAASALPSSTARGSPVRRHGPHHRAACDHRWPLVCCWCCCGRSGGDERFRWLGDGVRLQEEVERSSARCRASQLEWINDRVAVLVRVEALRSSGQGAAARPLPGRSAPLSRLLSRSLHAARLRRLWSSHCMCCQCTGWMQHSAMRVCETIWRACSGGPLRLGEMLATARLGFEPQACGAARVRAPSPNSWSVRTPLAHAEVPAGTQ